MTNLPWRQVGYLMQFGGLRRDIDIDKVARTAPKTCAATNSYCVLLWSQVDSPLDIITVFTVCVVFICQLL